MVKDQRGVLQEDTRGQKECKKHIRMNYLYSIRGLYMTYIEKQTTKNIGVGE